MQDKAVASLEGISSPDQTCVFCDPNKSKYVQQDLFLVMCA